MPQQVRAESGVSLYSDISNIFRSGLWYYLSLKIQETPDYLKILASNPQAICFKENAPARRSGDSATSARSVVTTSLLMFFLSEHLPEDATDPRGGFMEKLTPHVSKQTHDKAAELICQQDADPDIILTPTAGFRISAWTTCLLLAFKLVPVRMGRSSLDTLKDMLNGRDYSVIVEKDLVTSNVTLWELICSHVRVIGYV